jgi:AAA domain (dynein-related subfamily)
MAKVKDQRAVKVYDENGNIIVGSRPSTTNSYSSNNGSLNSNASNEPNTIERYTENVTKTENQIKQEVMEGIEELQNTMLQFDTAVTPRMVSTMLHHSNPESYLYGYLKLTGRECDDFMKKTQSQEWRRMMNKLKSANPKRINKRLAIYFGPPGGGKTTAALREAGKKIGMHKDMTAKELMFDFTFKDGEAQFSKSVFAQAMENGEAIVCDEMNLASNTLLQFMQSVLDNSKSIFMDGQELVIKEGFKVIGTMNDVVSGVDRILPEPIIDRALDIRYFELTPSKIYEYMTSTDDDNVNENDSTDETMGTN